MAIIKSTSGEYKNTKTGATGSSRESIGASAKGSTSNSKEPLLNQPGVSQVNYNPDGSVRDTLSRPERKSDLNADQIGTPAMSPEADLATRQGIQKDVNRIAGELGVSLNKTSTGDFTTTPVSPFKTGFEQATQSGAVAPTTSGQARGAVQQYMPPAQEDTSSVDSLLLADPGWQNLQQMREDYFEPLKQKDTLMSEYKKLYKGSGLDELDEEIIDAKTIIEGTEDDIRNEIQMAGGFGTDSQIQALASSRNKVLLKNYNNLVAIRESKQNHLDTMLSLAEKDRAYADQKFDKMMDFDIQLIDYKNKFVDNTRDQLNNMANKLGYKGLYEAYANDPRQLAFAEKILGLPSGGMLQLASQRDLDREVQEAQLANIYGQIAERGQEKTKPATQEQLKIAGYKDRLLESDQIINRLGDRFTGAGSYLSGLVPNILKSSDRQSFDQAQRNFINAVLRRESGAAISDDEFDNARMQYFPQPGDTQQTLQQKANNRRTVINSFARESSAVQSQYVVAPDGSEIELTD